MHIEVLRSLCSQAAWANDAMVGELGAVAITDQKGVKFGL